MHIVPLVSIALAAGILVDRPILAALLLIPALAVARLRRFAVPMLAFLAGCLLAGPAALGPLVSAVPEGSCLVHLTGRAATGADSPFQGRFQFVLDVETASGVDLFGRVRVLAMEGSPLPAPGAKVAATGFLVRPRRAGNPGESDPRDALARRGISHLVILKTTNSLRILAAAPRLSPTSWLHRSRSAIQRRIRTAGDRATADFLSCLLLGRRETLSERTQVAFRRTGTAHFLAISGLHVGLLAGLLWLVFRLLPIPRAAAAILVGATAIVYAGLTGFRPPAARAALLVALVGVGTCLRRKPRAWHLLATAAILLLVADPASLSRAGFQLSFAAVISILHLTKPITEGLFARYLFLQQFSVPGERPWIFRTLMNYAVRAIPVSLAAWLGTAPIILTEFGTISLLVVPANLVVFPFIVLLVPIGIAGLVVGWFLPATALVHGLVFVVAALSAIPGTCPTLPAPPLVVVILWYATLLLAGRARRIGRVAVLLLLAGLGTVAISGLLLRRAPAEPRLTVLSVGHGLCVALETPEGGVALYDAGSRRPALGRRTILPWLRWRRIAAVDALVLSHDDIDHTSAAAAIRRALPIDAFHPPGHLGAGDRFEIPGAEFEVLWPPIPTRDAGNDDSTVIRVRAGTFSVLLTGDIEQRSIADLLATGKDLTADVLILPHHGHAEEGARALVQAVNARVLIASGSGAARLDAAYRGALRTSDRGAVTVFAGGRVETFR